MKRWLKCELADNEISDLRSQLADLVIRLKKKEDELKVVSAPVKADIQEAKAIISEITKKLEKGHEYRDIDCYEEISGNKVLLIRRDTGEVVESRPITDKDRQFSFAE